MNSSQNFALQIATVGGLLGGMVIALAITKDYSKAKTYGLVLGTVGAIAGYSLAKRATDTKS